MQTRLGTPKFMVFHEFIPDIMNLASFRPFSLERLYLNSCQCLNKIVTRKLEKISDFMEFKKNSQLNNLNLAAQCMDAQCLTGPAHPGFRVVQSHVPHSQLVCLAELQCQYLSPWSYHTLSYGCQNCTNLNLVVISESCQCRLHLTSSNSV